MHGRKRQYTIRVLTFSALGLLVAAGVYWWLRPSWSGSQGAPAVGTNPPAAHDNSQLGFAAASTFSEADAAAEGCRPGAVIVNDPTDPAMDRKLAARIEAAREGFQAALIQSTDNREQALGLMLQSAAATSARHADNPATLDELAQLAQGSGDPAVYEIALLTCQRAKAGSGATSCESLSASKWSEIDSDNAVPWLTLASEASQLHDTVNEATDFHQAAVAHRFENYGDSLLAIAQPAESKDLTPLEQYYLNAEVIGAASAMVLPYARAARDCDSANSGNWDASADCWAIAERMVASGGSLIQFGIGIRMGERSGWPGQLLSDLKREHAALIMLALGSPRDLTSVQSCHEAIREMERAKRWSAIGEVAALRAELPLSGQSEEDLAAQYEQWNARFKSTGKPPSNPSSR